MNEGGKLKEVFTLAIKQKGEPFVLKLFAYKNRKPNEINKTLNFGLVRTIGLYMHTDTENVLTKRRFVINKD